MDKRYVWAVLQYQDSLIFPACYWEPVWIFDNKEDAVETARSYNKQYATPELIDENYDYRNDCDYDWDGGEHVYKVKCFKIMTSPEYADK